MQYVAIVLGNLILAWMCFRGRVDYGELLWVFWCQSVLIGVGAAVRMSLLRRFSTEGCSSNGKPIPETPSGKRSTVAFFVLHYGFFHVLYAVFLVTNHSVPWLQITVWGAVALAAFTVGEIVSAVQHASRDRSWRPNIGTLMVLPYFRIVPMHLAILSSGFVQNRADGLGDLPLLIFLLLKTGADAGMQLVDDRLEAKRQAAKIASGGSDAD